MSKIPSQLTKTEKEALELLKKEIINKIALKKYNEMSAIRSYIDQ